MSGTYSQPGRSSALTGPDASANCVAAQAQGDVESAKRQQAFFQQHLQELTLFKAKTSAALLQVCPHVADTWHSARAAS